jgi:transposase
MVSEKNIETLRDLGASWLVGTPKAMLKQFERSLLEERDWSKIEPGVEVKLCRAPDGSQETFVLCRSPLRAQKEKAMRRRQVEALQKALENMQSSAQAPRRALRNPDRAWMRVGRLMERFSRAAHLFEVNIREYADPVEKGKKRLTIDVRRKAEPQEWAARADGCYLLRTNLRGKSAEELWRTYMGLTQIEDSFRIAKHDLDLRPIFHQKPHRTQAHILVCFLSLALWRTLQQWMAASGLGDAPRKLLEEMRQVRSLDVVLPTPAGPELRLRTVSRPEPHLAILLERLDLPLPNQPKKIQNVVATFRPEIQKPEQLERFRL